MGVSHDVPHFDPPQSIGVEEEEEGRESMNPARDPYPNREGGTSGGGSFIIVIIIEEMN